MDNKYKMKYEEYPGVVEAKELFRLCGFKSDIDAALWLGYQKNYIRDLSNNLTVGGARGKDVPESILVTLRLAYKINALSKGHLLEILPDKPKKMSKDEIIDYAKKLKITKEALEAIGVVDNKSSAWAVKYLDLMKVMKKKKYEGYDYIKSPVYNPYIAAVGISALQYAQIVGIPQPTLLRKDFEPPSYYAKMAKLIYMFYMAKGRTINILSPLKINIVNIMWKDKADDLRLKIRIHGLVNNATILKRKLIKAGDDTEAIDKEIEEHKEELERLNGLLKYAEHDVANVIQSCGLREKEIEEIACPKMNENKNRRRFVWRGTVLPWVICFARLYENYKRTENFTRGTI